MRRWLYLAALMALQIWVVAHLPTIWAATLYSTDRGLLWTLHLPVGDLAWHTVAAFLVWMVAWALLSFMPVFFGLLHIRDGKRLAAVSRASQAIAWVQ